MERTNRHLIRPSHLGLPRLLLGLPLAVLLLVGSAARAAQPPSCGCDPTGTLAAYRDRIAEAPSLRTAQELAVEPVEQARSVLARMSWASQSIRDAEQRIAFYESTVQQAHAPGEVADRFGELLRLASSDAVVVDGGVARCHYSTGEIIAIVLGFILAIIPGIILLILLC